MKVLFYYRESEQIGIEYISAVLKQAGHEVDLLFDPGFDSKFSMAKSTGFLKKLSVEEKLIKQAIDFKPDLIGFSSENNVFPHAKKMAAKLKKVFPNVPIIFGGVQATTLPEYVLKDKNIDMVCIGEGELAVLELVNKMEKKQNYFNTKSIWFKKGNKIIKNEIRPLIQDLNSLPLPDRDLFFKYGAFKHHLMIVGSRGCPYNCTYCHNQFNKKLYAGKGTYVRRRSVDSIIEEIKLAQKKYCTTAIEFEDESFTNFPDLMKELCVRIKTEIKLPFFCQSRPNQLNDENVKLLKESGCAQIFMGIDSGDKKIRDEIMGRYTTDEQILNAASLLRKYKIPFQATAIFGSPNETPEQMWKTITLIEKVKANAVPTYTLFPFPGTPLFDYCKKNGFIDKKTIELIKSGDYGDHDKSILKHPYKELAYNISKLLSLYIRAPFFIKPLIKRLMINKKVPGVSLAYLLCLPFDYPFYSWERIRVFSGLLLLRLKSFFIKRN